MSSEALAENLQVVSSAKTSLPIRGKKAWSSAGSQNDHYLELCCHARNPFTGRKLRAAMPDCYDCDSWWFACSHQAIRKREGNTVMLPRKIRMRHNSSRPRPGNDVPDDRRTLDILFSVTYEELRRLASAVKRSDANATLSPTTLVNEAWLKLAGAPEFASQSPLHFKRIAAQAMRQILIDAARRRSAQKRGGREVIFVAFGDSSDQIASCDEELIALDAALEELARLNPRQAVMIESRFFGGLDIAETAALLEVSDATILRDWRAAKAWLAREIRRAR